MSVSDESRIPLTSEDREELLASNTDEDLLFRASVNIHGETEKRLMSRLAEREAERILRAQDSGGDPPLRESLLDFQGLLNLPTPEWLVGDLLPEHSLAFVAGQPASYKSFFALQVAVGVATGTDVFGGPTIAGDVLYVAAEGASGQRARGEAQALRLGADATALFQRFRLIRRPIDLLDQRHVDQLVEIVAERDTKLVVIDTLARCTPGADENSATAMGVAVSALSRVKDEGDGRCVLVVHHSVKAPGGPPLRGSGALNGAADTVHHITRGDGSPFVQVANTKQKDAEERAPFTLEFTAAGSSGYLAMSSHIDAAQHRVSASGHRLDMIVVLVMSMTGPTMKDLIEATGMSRTTLTRDLQELISRGDIVAKAESRVTRYYRAEVDE